ADTAAADATTTRAALADATARESQAAAARRRSEDAERSAGRAAETAAREAGWHAGQADRLEAEAARLAEALTSLDASATAGQAGAESLPADQAAVIEGWEARVAELRARRDAIAAELAIADRRRRDAEATRAA